MPIARLDEADIYFESYGEGPAVIFVHGSGGNHLSWWRQIPTLSQQFRCVIFDQRGFGFSRTAAGREDGMIEDVRGLMDHLRIQRAHLVGQSLGGRTCLGFSLAHPARVNGLVLAATIAGIDDPIIAQAAASGDPVPSGLMERALSQRFREEQRDLTFLYHEIAALNHVGSEPTPVSLAVFSRDDLTKLKIPTLFIVGTGDPVARPQLVKLAASLISGARCEIVPDAGHSVYLERPKIFNELIQSFLVNL